ncbi:MAG: hypothetical protein QXT67_04780 [Candidatus Bathyarchaeia archaeon]
MRNYSEKSYKFVSLPRARKLALLSNIRDVQRLVLSYASNFNVFCAADVVIYFGLKNKYGDDANKRVHDAIKRLERRGVVERVSWGLYRLKVGLSVEDLSSRTRKLYGGVGFGFGGGGCGGVFRVHVRPCWGGLGGFFVRLLVAGVFVGWALRFVEGELVRVYGRRFVRRLRRFVRRNVVVRGGVLGCHGRYGRRGECLLPVGYLDSGYVSEVGVDLLAGLPRELEKMFVKMYFRRVGVDKSLDEYIGTVEECLGIGAKNKPKNK